MSPPTNVGSSQHLAAGPRFPQVLTEGSGSCWGYELNQGSRSPSKDTQDDPITSPFSSTPSHVVPRHPHPGSSPARGGQGRRGTRSLRTGETENVCLISSETPSSNCLQLLQK